MTFSQNAFFKGQVAEDPQFEHPPGAALMRVISLELARSGWSTSVQDNWRDVGWSVACVNDRGALEVVLAQVDDGWLLQIAPASAPGFVGRLLGRHASADRAACLRIAVQLHELLAASDFRELRWRWDGYPELSKSTPTPEPYASSAV